MKNFKKLIIISILSLLNLTNAQADFGKHKVDFHGYFRIGLGMSEDGTAQAQFQAPGAPASYRLGNEPNTNIELAFDYRYKIFEGAPKNSYIQIFAMPDEFENIGSSSNLGLDRIAQLYIRFANFIGEGVNVWAGRIYYDRKDIHMNDYYWLNTGQGAHAGFGIENVSIGSGNLNFAMFRYEDSVNDSSDNAQLVNSTSYDLRYKDLKIGENGNLNFWLYYALRAPSKALNYEKRSGLGAGFWYGHRKVFGGDNTFAAIYKKGPAVNQSDSNGVPVNEGGGFDLKKASMIDVNNNLLANFGNRFSMQFALAYRSLDYGQTNTTVNKGKKVIWTSAGIRPIYYLSDIFNLALEIGHDRIDDKYNDQKGDLTKYTFAVQLQNGRGYYRRPVIRWFVTSAKWSEQFKGQIGGSPGDDPHGNRTSGWSTGFQVEAWW